MSNKRWEFTGETKVRFGITLRKIRAAVEFELKCGIVISKGELGGWIEKESNLSGNAWVSGNAIVFDNAIVSGNAIVFDNAIVSGSARVFGYARVSGNAEVSCNARVSGNAWVSGNAEVSCNAEVYGNARVSGDARVFGSARVFGYARVSGNAEIKSSEDYCVYKNTWSSLRWFTYTKSNKMWLAGCFYGTGAELITRAYKNSEKSGKCYEAIVKAQEAIEKAMDV